jgi:hypothetical protein
MGQESLPTPGLFVDADILSLYQENVDQVIADLGRQITIYLPPSTSGCPNCFAGFDGASNGEYDNTNSNPINGGLHKPFPDGGVCPVCKGSHKIFTTRTAQYTATIGRDTKDIFFDQSGKQIEPQNVYRTKTVLASFEDIKNSTKMRIDGETCIRIRDPIKTGLQELRYVNAWWQRID